MRTIAIEGELNASRRDREGFGYDMRVNLGTIRSALWSQVPFYIFDEPINDDHFFGPIECMGTFNDLADDLRTRGARFAKIMRIGTPERCPGNTSDPVSPGR